MDRYPKKIKLSDVSNDYKVLCDIVDNYHNGNLVNLTVNQKNDLRDLIENNQ